MTAEPPSSRADFQAGDLVWSFRYRHDGPAKLLSITGDTAHLEYFDSIASSREVSVPLRSVRHFSTEQGQRCFTLVNGRWRAGRILNSSGPDAYFVEFGGWREAIPTRDIYLRWHRPISDIVGVLAAGGQEPVSAYNSRRAFVDSVVRQRAGSEGVDAFLSSAVELHRHQLEVANRILTDPVRRYLLADEVGLGKTIEAGFVIRQAMLEDSELNVIVAVPELLTEQWRSELEKKFYLDDFNEKGQDEDKRIRVIGHDELFEVKIPGLLVIDEAHRLVTGWDREPAATRYQRLAALTAKVQALLLLSATPLLHNEATFLAMLHLVDPANHRLGDLDAFRARVEQRRTLARSYRGLSVKADDYVLERLVKTFNAEYPTDTRLAGLLDEVLAHASEGEQSEALGSAVMAARIHLSETYRLHQRVLRTRRVSATAASFPVRGRRRPIAIEDDDPRRGAVDLWIRDWLMIAAEEATLRAGGEETLNEAAIAVLDAAGTDWEGLRALAVAALAASPGPDEAEAWKRLLVTLDAEPPATDRIDAIVRLVGDLPLGKKAVVFTTRSAVAVKITQRLRDEYKALAIAQHLADDPRPEALRNVDRFRTQAVCRVLVCDHSAEEGRNLQFADVAIHHDLPWSPNRLEQRLGRLDRYGQGDKVTSYVFNSPAEDEPTLEDIWLDCLTDGLGLFDASLASLQHFAETIPEELLSLIRARGSEGFPAWVTQLAARVDTEQTAVRELDELEATEVSDLSVVITDLNAVDAEWAELQEANEALLLQSQGHDGLGFQVHIGQDAAVRRYPPPGNKANRALLNITNTEFQELFGDHAFEYGTCQRQLAVAHPGFRLRRLGDPLVEALRTFTTRHDRGRVFSLWRTDPTWHGTPLVAFRFDLLAEANIGELPIVEDIQVHWEGRSLQRRADMCFPPFLTSVWIDHDGRSLKPKHLAVADRPFTPRTDKSLFGVTELADLVGGDWESTCRDAEAAARAKLATSERWSERLRQAEARAKNQVFVELERRRLRLELAPNDAAKKQLAVETDLFTAFREGVSSPRVTIDAVGVVVVSPTPQGRR